MDSSSSVYAGPVVNITGDYLNISKVASLNAGFPASYLSVIANSSIKIQSAGSLQIDYIALLSKQSIEIQGSLMPAQTKPSTCIN
jgi:hypothetical protein